jgi:hypothetical protein
MDLMSGPFVYISTHRLKEGHEEEALQNARQVADLVREREPQLIAFDFFLNEDGTELTVTQVHPDVASMYTHMGVIRDHIEHFGDYLEPQRVAVYGEGTEAYLEDLRRIFGPDVALDVKNRWVAGSTLGRQGVSV